MPSPDKTNAEIYLEMFVEHSPATAYEIMDVISMKAADGKLTDVEKFRLIQGIHGACSMMVDDGRLERVGTKINPDTGREIYIYAIPKAAIAPVKKVSKGYKEKYEEALVQIELMQDQIASQKAFITCLVRERDEARRRAA